MEMKFLKLSLVIGMLVLMYACNEKTPSAFKDISMVYAVSDKKGFLDVRTFFPKDEKPFIQYVNRDGTLRPALYLIYTRKQTDKKNNSVIYFFEDQEYGSQYQYRVKEGIVARVRVVTDKNNIPYSVIRCEKREIIPLEQDGNMRFIIVEVNGMKLKFLLDTGASDILISIAEAIFLLKQGLIKEEDILEESKEYKIADGSLMIGDVINLRSVKIGNKTLKNVKATVIDNPYAELLLGQSVLSQFGKVTIDNKNNELILE
jgi:aspartyl protease family protein